MKKGISPLVAAVLLIAVTMTIAGMLAYWASSFVRSQVTAFENQSITSQCNFADFNVYSCRYLNASNEIRLFLENIRNIELKDIVVYVVYANDTVSTHPQNITLPGGTIKSFTVTGVSSNYTKITIKTHCPELSKTVSC